MLELKEEGKIIILIFTFKKILATGFFSFFSLFTFKVKPLTAEKSI